MAEITDDKLQQYAAKVLHTPVEYIDTLQLSLAQHVKNLTPIFTDITTATILP